jgi:hypothetical protein
MAGLLDDPQWVDAVPPHGKRSGRPVSPVWAKLRANPGQWALIATGVTRSAGHNRARQHPECEVVVRNERTVDGRRVVDVYARYIGEEPF